MNNYDYLKTALKADVFDEDVITALNEMVEFFRLFDELPVGSHLAKYANGQWRINVPITYGWDRFIAATPLEAARMAITSIEEIK